MRVHFSPLAFFFAKIYPQEMEFYISRDLKYNFNPLVKFNEPYLTEIHKYLLKRADTEQGKKPLALNCSCMILQQKKKLLYGLISLWNVIYHNQVVVMVTDLFETFVRYIDINNKLLSITSEEKKEREKYWWKSVNKLINFKATKK